VVEFAEEKKKTSGNRNRSYSAARVCCLKQKHHQIVSVFLVQEKFEVFVFHYGFKPFLPLKTVRNTIYFNFSGSAKRGVVVLIGTEILLAFSKGYN